MKVIDDDEFPKKKKTKMWSVCYSYDNNPGVMHMMRLKSLNEETAWIEVVRRLTKENALKTAHLRYAVCTE